jgi:8-oxo-dGTP diphosphatase
MVKEIARHVLRRPVVGIGAAARTDDGRWVLIRRTDTEQWALPGGTLEWGETLRTAIRRELAEEAGVRVLELGEICGVYSKPERDARFHAVTIIVHARVSMPERPPVNPVEISEVGVFSDDELPSELSYGMKEMLDRVRSNSRFWE